MASPDNPDWTEAIAITSTTTVGGPLSVYTISAGSGATGQVSVGTSATQIVAARTNRTGCTIHNLSTSGSVAYVGFAGVTTGTGFALEPGHSITMAAPAAIYGIVASGSNTVSFEDE